MSTNRVHTLPTTDADLLEHREHLPEVQTCICGYVRAESDVPLLVPTN